MKLEEKIKDIINSLEALEKWNPYAGCNYDIPGIDWEKEDDGEWIKIEDVQEIIKLLTKA